MTQEDFLRQWHDGKNYITAHTSGSTGIPKEIRLLKSDMLASARATNRFFQLRDDSVYLCPLSLDYIAGKMMAVRAIESGGTAVFIEPSNSPAFSPCDLLAIVPSQVEALLNSPELSNISNIIIGGAPLSDEMRNALVKSGANAYESYGMTETCSHIALRHVSEKHFRTMPGIRISTDDRGCLVADIPNMSIGCVITNDLVELSSPTAFRWIGRYDNIINSGGIKIIPEQLESEIQDTLKDTAFSDTPFCISSRPDPKWGRRVVMLIEGSPETAESMAHIISSIDSIHRPKEVIAVHALPRTANGKIRRL